MALLPCSVAFNLLLDELDPGKVELDACYASEAAIRRRVLETFAPVDPSGKMGADWDEERERLRELVPPAEECAAALARAGLPLRYEELPVPIPEEQARWAFANAHLMRKRLSSAELLHLLGWFDAAFTERVFARMAELTAGR